MNGIDCLEDDFFDTLIIRSGQRTKEIHKRSLSKNINLRRIDEEHIGISLDETTSMKDIENVLEIFTNLRKIDSNLNFESSIPEKLKRTSSFLDHEVFKRYRTETELVRYIRKLSDKDIALDRAMIPLGSCTMKLNATSEMIPVSWPGVFKNSSFRS